MKQHKRYKATVSWRCCPKVNPGTPRVQEQVLTGLWNRSKNIIAPRCLDLEFPLIDRGRIKVRDVKPNQASAQPRCSGWPTWNLHVTPQTWCQGHGSGAERGGCAASHVWKTWLQLKGFWTAVFGWGHVIISLRQYKHFFLWIVTFLPMMHTCTGTAAHTGCRIRTPDLWLRGKSRGSGTNPSRHGRGQA